MSSAIIVHADGLPQPQRNRAVLTTAIGLAMAVTDGAIANVALPTIAKDLNASPAFGAALSILRLSEAGARGAERVRVREDQRLKGE